MAYLNYFLIFSTSTMLEGLQTKDFSNWSKPCICSPTAARHQHHFCVLIRVRLWCNRSLTFIHQHQLSTKNSMVLRCHYWISLYAYMRNLLLLYQSSKCLRWWNYWFQFSIADRSACCSTDTVFWTWHCQKFCSFYFVLKLVKEWCNYVSIFLFKCGMSPDGISS